MSRYHPGTDAAVRFPDWVVRHRDLQGIPEVLCRRRKVILVERALPVAERRCALAHALAHLDLGHTTDGMWAPREELAADRLAARRLIALDELAAALLADLPPVDVAALLEVTEEYVALRIKSLHPAERGWLTGRLAAREAVA